MAQKKNDHKPANVNTIFAISFSTILRKDRHAFNHHHRRQDHHAWRPRHQRPPHWSTYRLNTSVKVTTGQVVLTTGCYLPEIDDSCAAFMIAGEEAAEACVGFDPNTMQYVSRDPTTWTLIERVSDTGVPSTPSLTDAVRLRCEANHPCPKEGWWFTPAKADSRRHFKQGDTMPDLGSAWGSTIWQWDDNQS